MDEKRLRGYLKLLERRRGEKPGEYDEVACVYDDFARVWDDHVAAPALRHVNELIAHHVAPGSRVLEAGCGTGERTRAILAHGHPAQVVAIDASQGMLAIAKSKIESPIVEFLRGDIRHLPFENDTFDIAITTWVVEILDDPRTAIEELVRVIKPTGVVIYAFCSLPEGPVGEVLRHVRDALANRLIPVSQLLSEDERPFHGCKHSSLAQFSGGLTTVATVSKCCPISNKVLPCEPGAIHGHLRDVL